MCENIEPCKPHIYQMSEYVDYFVDLIEFCLTPNRRVCLGSTDTNNEIIW